MEKFKLTQLQKFALGVLGVLFSSHFAHASEAGNDEDFVGQVRQVQSKLALQGKSIDVFRAPADARVWVNGGSDPGWNNGDVWSNGGSDPGWANGDVWSNGGENPGWANGDVWSNGGENPGWANGDVWTNGGDHPGWANG